MATTPTAAPTRAEQLRFLTLSFSGGVSGAYGAIYCDHVFANAETGNLVSMAYDLKMLNFVSAGARLVAVLLFLAAIVVSVKVPLAVCGGDRRKWRRICLLLEIGCFTLQVLLPYKELMAIAPAMYLWPTFFACALQYNTFTQQRGLSVSTVFSVNNLRQMALHFALYTETHDRAQRTVAWMYAANIASFVFGAFVSAFLMDWMGHWTLLTCVAVLTGNFIALAPGRKSALATALPPPEAEAG